jgi:hypothetical protein
MDSDSVETWTVTVWKHGQGQYGNMDRDVYEWSEDVSVARDVVSYLIVMLSTLAPIPRLF